VHNFEEGYLSEEAIIDYFKHLRMGKNGKVFDMDPLLLHQQYHEEEVQLETAVPPQDHHGHQEV
jgi:hypothetical protein